MLRQKYVAGTYCHPIIIIYSVNSKGPNMDPWCIPTVIDWVSELSLSKLGSTF